MLISTGGVPAELVNLDDVASWLACSLQVSFPAQRFSNTLHTFY